MVIVEWHGHACVSIKKSNDYTIVFDPHDGVSIGLPRPNVKGDLILVTHDHFDHNAVDIVKKESSRVFKEFHGEALIDDVKIEGIKTYHDKFQGRRRGINTVYVVEVEGYRIAHLGDLGHKLSDELIDKLRNIDLLIIPVGGTYTIGPDEAWDIITEVQPNNVLPIHYWVKGLNLPLFPIDDFLVYVKKYHVVRLDTRSFKLGEYEKSIIIPRI
ncbi:conserved hypothetical protein [Staphylothermus marinus F1]|uniref:Zn-dependent hydrolase n=1 Tax=Staphylothermus marinus (strain ATCC 43588 / DSM 3639 / JCM 9404 / F1) TaxID=399550 RepID=A3DP81_STAMF|nr:MBL fold metallo-hydrolase [Staphylothermus marinus]ABN70441.1 conserved hypothetical protein [Staphylothermus marinus F1]